MRISLAYTPRLFLSGSPSAQRVHTRPSTFALAHAGMGGSRCGGTTCEVRVRGPNERTMPQTPAQRDREGKCGRERSRVRCQRLSVCLPVRNALLDGRGRGCHGLRPSHYLIHVDQGG
eukprot:4848020-Prymnesium_polylepis.1